MCSKCSVVNYHTVLLAFALTVSPTASPKSSEKRASSRRPENGQRLAGNVGNSEVMVGAAFFDLDKSKGWAIRIWHGAYRLFPYPVRIEFHGSAAVCSPSRSYGLQPARWSLRNLRALG